MSMNGNQRGILLESGTNEVEFLEFLVAGQSFAINVAKVREALMWRHQDLTELPYSPDAVLGTVLVRGASVLTIDFRSLLDLDGTDVPDDSKILLVMDFNQFTTGFLIDSVMKVERFSWDNFKPLSRGLPTAEIPSVVGTITIEDRVVMVLDVESLMSEVNPNLNILSDDTHGHQSGQSDEDKPLRIAYAEDSSLVRKKMCKELRRAGFNDISEFTTGLALLEYLERQGSERVDIIISDIEMPRMDGLTVCKRTKENPELAGIPFIFVSSLIDEPMKVKCKSVGGTACFSKREIMAMIEMVQNHYEEMRELVMAR